MMPPRILASGPKPCGGNKLHLTFVLVTFKYLTSKEKIVHKLIRNFLSKFCIDFSKCFEQDWKIDVNILYNSSPGRGGCDTGYVACSMRQDEAITNYLVLSFWKKKPYIEKIIPRKNWIGYDKTSKYSWFLSDVIIFQQKKKLSTLLNIA